MKRNIIAIAAGMLIASYGCSNHSSKHEQLESSEALLKTTDTIPEKIIKTAEMRFRVTNTRQAKVEISAYLQKIGGKLVESDLHTEIHQSEKVPYSADSLLEITSYQTEGKIIARVPSADLDAFTDFIAQNADFIHHQSLILDDQRLSYLGRHMKVGNKADAIAMLDGQPKKTDRLINTSLALKDQYVDQKITNMQVDDQVKYSTIMLSFYQHHAITKAIIANDNLSGYRPGFLKRAGLNFTAGWTIFKEVILMLINLWIFLAMAIMIYYVIIYNRKRRQAHQI